MTEKTPYISPTLTQGRMPAWFWRDMLRARENAGNRVPMLIVKEEQHQLVVLTLSDYNALIDTTRKDGDQ